MWSVFSSVSSSNYDMRNEFEINKKKRDLWGGGEKLFFIRGERIGWEQLAQGLANLIEPLLLL